MNVWLGIMGWVVLGYDVVIVSDSGDILLINMFGNIVVRILDLVMFLNYWNNVDVMDKKFVGGWFLIGDIGEIDD